MSYPVSNNYKKEEIEMSLLARAMGHPARITILNFLVSQNNCYFGDIDKELSISKSTVSQHLTLLKEARLIHGSIEPPKVRYCINPVTWQIAKELFTGFFKQQIKCCKSK